MKTEDQKKDVKRFRNLRNDLMVIGFVPKTCREEGPYYYSRNGGTMKERSGGHVARMTRQMVKQLGINTDRFEFPICSWCSNYPRTKKSMAVEAVGQGNFWTLFWKLVAFGVLDANGFIVRES